MWESVDDNPVSRELGAESAMTIFAENEPLTEPELDRLHEFLRGYEGGKAISTSLAEKVRDR
jgi:hypothetical protein